MIRSLAVLLAVVGCQARAAAPPVIGVAFETLQTEYWIASFEVMRAEIARRGLRTLEAIADGDANRQLEQVRSFIARRVAGIIIAPKDAHTVLPMIRAANQAGIPIVLYNRAPAPSALRSITVGVDNFGITKATVARMCALAKRSGKPREALILIGDLGDTNAIGRRDGFDRAVDECGGTVRVLARIPTEWNQEKALAGITNALQAHPGIDFVFSSSDFMLPSVVSALKNAGKYHRTGEPGHVLLGSFDGDSLAHRLLRDGYLDVDGVQDAYYQSAAAVQAILDARAGATVAERVLDPGLVVDQENLASESGRMWGARAPKTQ